MQYQLMSYTRRPTSREKANNADIATSMHLALRSAVTGKWEALNDNYGILFASAYRSTNARKTPWKIPLDDLTLTSLADPFLLSASGRGWYILSTRCKRGGEADGSEKNSFLVTYSPDLIHFQSRGRFILPTAHGIHHPRGIWDSADRVYRVMWENDEGTSQYICVPTLNPPLATSGNDRLSPLMSEEPATRPQNCVIHDGKFTIPGYPLAIEDANLPDAQPVNSITIDEQTAHQLICRYGRAYNTHVRVNPVDVLASLSADEVETVLAQQPALLTYSDGSSAQLPVDWDQEDKQTIIRTTARMASDNAASTTASTAASETDLTVHGTIRRTTYPVPFAVERADPSIFNWNYNVRRIFMFIATEDMDGNCIDPACGAHMPLRIGSTISELADANGGKEREIDLLKAGDKNSEGRPMTGCFWAPELHVIGGKLSILFMPCFDGEEINPDTGEANPRAGKPDMWTGCCHIMQLGKNADGTDKWPGDPKNWDAPRPIVRTDGSKLNPIRRISLDMTTFTDGGRSYYAWQQEGSVWIATYDPADPTYLTSDPTQIIVPEFAWDNSIAEGPFALKHDDKIFLIYSGSLVGIDYATGVVVANQGSDLTDPQSWTKLNYPLQKSDVFNGHWQLGTGHGMFSTDEDGNLLYVFHAAEYHNGRYGGRDAQVRRVYWRADGLPVLDRQADEEVSLGNDRVQMRVHIYSQADSHTKPNTNLH